MKPKSLKKTKFENSQIQSFDDFSKNKSFIDLSQISVAEQDQLDLLLGLFKDSKNKRLLDAGCGTGTQSIRLAKHFKEIIGIDPSKESIAVAEKTIKKYKIKNFKAFNNGLETSNYNHEFDYILMTNVLHHVENADEILEYAKKALKPTGSLIFFEQNPLNPLFIPFLLSLGMLKSHLNIPYIRSNIFTLQKIFKRNGLHTAQIIRYAFLPSLLYSYSLAFKKINEFLNKIPFINIFCAFHIIVCRVNKN